jgi:hypothetical protein
MEAAMQQVKTRFGSVLVFTGLLSLSAAAIWSIPARGQAPAGGVTVFEGARILVGDGRAPIENATIVVSGDRIEQVGRAADV